MSFDCLEKVSKKLKRKLPRITKVLRHSHTKEAGSKGGVALLKKYGKVPIDEVKRKERWKLWWEKEGRYKKLPKSFYAKKLHIPRKSKKLAEFIGIMIGDGSVSPYHVSITLNARDDGEYVAYVAQLVEELFLIKPGLQFRPKQNTVNIVVYRKLLVEYVRELGLPLGDKIKNGVSIPEWILKSSLYTKACVRGLVDTDGSIFTHSYLSKGKRYEYKKLSFTSASPKLCLQVKQILFANNINSQIHGKSVKIENKDTVKRYLKVIGSSNPKHLKRWGK